MKRADFEKIRLLSAKERLEIADRYKRTEEEKSELERLREEFNYLDNTIGKAIFYMHDFLGISHREIANILHYTKPSVIQRYYETKTILIED